MEPIRLTIPIEPRGQMRPRHAKIGSFSKTYKDEKQRLYEAKIGALLAQYRPEKPLEGCLRLTVAAYLSIPASKPKRWKAAALDGTIKPTGKPDCDNILKNLFDIMNGVFWGDDKQITRASVYKRYSDNPRWEIEIKEDV